MLNFFTDQNFGVSKIFKNIEKSGKKNLKDHSRVADLKKVQYDMDISFI